MSRVSQFVDSLRQYLPGQKALLDTFAQEHTDDPTQLMKELADRSLLSHARLCQLWADTLGVAYVNPFNVELPSDPAYQLPAEVSRRAQAIVLNTLADTATVAMVDPTDARLIESITKVLGRNVSPVYSHPSELSAIIDLHFGADQNLAGSLQNVCDNWPTLDGSREIRTAQDATELVGSKAFKELFNSIVLTAFKRRASDIHFESGADDCQVRMRIDGDMTHILTLPRAVHEALVVRIKVLCGLDVSQSRLPQDGAFEINFGGKRPAFRASTIPSLYGEKGVLRILGSSMDQSVPRLGSLGLADSTRKALKRSILHPNGIVLVCGPTGSGKTTTLYACLNELNRPDLNIVTIEDPVEYRLRGVNQHQANSQIGLTFASILRSILRQDPDVILVGEIRDHETASIATEAALTGHLVLSSLHTNNSLQAITRLTDIGVDPYMVAPTITGVISQRLVRRICSTCKESYKATHDDLAPFFHNPDAAPVTLYRGKGCPKCYGTGFVGRLGIYEIVEATEELRDLILRRASPMAMLEEARRVGFRSMRYDGLKKALLGWTTLDEVLRNTLPDMVSVQAEK